MTTVDAPQAGSTRTVELLLTGERTPITTLLGDAWRSRDLLRMLARHDFNARYRSAALGVLWSVLLPLLQGIVFAVVFSRVVKIPISGNVGYTGFVITGTMTWAYVTASVTAGSTAIVDAGEVASKLYFPRMLLPAVPVLANLPGLAISLGVAFIVTVVTGTAPSIWLLLAPLAALTLFALAASVSEVTALLHVYYRDVRYIVTAIILLALYVGPVIYPLNRAHALRPLIEANPATGPLQLVRQALLGAAPGGLALPMATFSAWVVLLSIIAVLGFSRHERIVMDRL